MAKRERILILDIGSTAVHCGEFDFVGGGSMVLRAFTNVEYTENITEANRSIVIGAALRRALEEGGFATQKCSICVSGQAAFMRFVKLPPVTEEESRVRQIVEYEARQNVPFPMEEVIWDYQLIGGDEEELEVMFAVIKNDIVEGVIRAVTDLDLQPNLVDFAPAALYNAARANYVGEDECAMLLDIGGRCTNLLFLDGERFFARAIPIAGFTITQQIAKEFGISTEEAEILKRRHGFVALGGAYEEPESEVAATISKIIRNVMTRLHGEINRSINVYRTQQKGNKPTHLYLSGGSSTMAFTDHFFSEKLRMEVSYFNPFKVVNLDESLDTQQLQEVAHMFPEVVGVALRNAVECPVEISLITDSIKKHQLFTKRRPFILTSCFVWLCILTVFTLVNYRKATLYKDTYDLKFATVEKYDLLNRQTSEAENNKKAAIEKYKVIQNVLDRRTTWMHLLNSIQDAKPIDVWIDYARPLAKPVIDPKAVAVEKPKTEDEMGLGMEMGEGGLFGSTESDSGKADAAKDTYEWFDIKAHCITIAEFKRTADGDVYTRPVFTDEQFKKLKEAFDAAHEAAQPTSALGGPATPAAPTDEKFNEFKSVIQKGNRIDLSTNLPDIFVDAIRLVPEFSDDASEIRVVAFVRNPNFANVHTFRIQVKLKKTISGKMP